MIIIVNTKKEENEIKKCFVHIAFSENELNEIKRYSKDIGITRSEFLREAVKDKIMRIETPENFNNQKSIDIKPILQLISNNTQKIDLIVEKIDVITKIQDNLKLLNSIVNSPILIEKEQKIIELLKKHIELKPKEISRLLKLSIEDVYSVISNEKVFSVNIKTGGIVLNE